MYKNGTDDLLDSKSDWLQVYHFDTLVFLFLPFALSPGLKTPLLFPRLAEFGVKSLEQVGQAGENQSACVVAGDTASSAAAVKLIIEKTKTNNVNFIKTSL